MLVHIMYAFNMCYTWAANPSTAREALEHASHQVKPSFPERSAAEAEACK